MFRIFSILLVILGLLLGAVQFRDNIASKGNQEHIRGSFDPVPGKTFHLKIPNISGEPGWQERVCELRIPENYQKGRSVPILVWFAPGTGSNSVSSVPPIVDFKKYLVLALPYPDNQLPRLAVKAGTIDSFWEYQKPMLEYVKDIIPDISDDVRIAGGFSSGAHLVGSGLDMDWPGFTDFFTVYVMHEGGYSPHMKYIGARSTHKILLTYGGAINSYGKVVERNIKITPADLTVRVIPETGHAMNVQTINTIRRWIDEKL